MYHSEHFISTLDKERLEQKLQGALFSSACVCMMENGDLHRGRMSALKESSSAKEQQALQRESVCLRRAAQFFVFQSSMQSSKQIPVLGKCAHRIFFSKGATCCERRECSLLRVAQGLVSQSSIQSSKQLLTEALI